jgi:hypothetical protein
MNADPASDAEARTCEQLVAGLEQLAKDRVLDGHLDPPRGARPCECVYCNEARLLREAAAALRIRSDDGGLAETARRHAADCRRQEAQRTREAHALEEEFLTRRGTQAGPDSSEDPL